MLLPVQAFQVQQRRLDCMLQDVDLAVIDAAVPLQAQVHSEFAFEKSARAQHAIRGAAAAVHQLPVRRLPCRRRQKGPD